MGKKYELTGTVKNYGDRKVYRIQALKNFGNVKKGDLGGWVESEENLSQKGKCWIYDNAEVFENAKVYGNAKIKDDAWVNEDAEVFENAVIKDDACISGHAMVYGNAKVDTESSVFGYCEIAGKAKVTDCSTVSGSIIITDGIVSSNHKDSFSEKLEMKLNK